MASPKQHGLVVLAGGSGSRMGAGVNKQLLTLQGSTITEITLKQFLRHNRWQQIVLVVAQKDWSAMEAVVQKVSCDFGVTIDQVTGGAERQMSVAAGISALNPEIQTVWIHDGARPFVESDLLERLAKAIEDSNAVIPGVPSKDTLKRVVDGEVHSTIDRSAIYRIQTPQCFERETLERMQHLAHRQEGFTDDASIAEALGIPVTLVMGSEWNIKLTTPEDLVLGLAIYEHLKGEGKCV